MVELSPLYRRLLADPGHEMEVKVDVAGVEYGQEMIYALSTTSDLFPDFAVGACVSRKVSLTLSPMKIVPRMARITIYTRAVLGTEASEWAPDGVFHVDTRTENQVSGLLTLNGFDAMMKAENTWLDPSQGTGEWPMTQRAAAADIAGRMGVSIDPRTSIQDGYTVDYPNDLTMREALAEIAVSNCGNWRMTGDGKLLLVPLGGFPDETALLVDGEDGGAILFGDVRILVR